MSSLPSGQSSNPIQYQHYRELPAGFYEEALPAASPAPTLIALNKAFLEAEGIASDWFQSEAGLAAFAGNADYDNPPIAMAYAAHQFGHWVPLLGDGRAHMLGQMRNANGDAIDVQLKGSGRTRFSRGGDGLATLGSMLREYIVSEAMHGLGIPTTRSLAVIGTGGKVMREEVLPGAIVVRTALSHIRIGGFQYAITSQGEDGVKALADFVITHYYPALASHPDKYAELLHAVIEGQATLIAQWMLVGFIHGVMNTDNMSIVGETIDYGPCAFMDEFHPNKVFSSIDQHGRYAWDQQPNIALWNLTQLASCLLPLLHDDEEEAAAIARSQLDTFAPAFRAAFNAGMAKKLGLDAKVSNDEITTLAETTFGVLAESSIDFTVFFDLLTRVAAGESQADLIALFDDPAKGEAWLAQWSKHKSDNPDVLKAMRMANPAVIARNHRVEEAIEAATKREDFAPFRRLCAALVNPYEVAAEDVELQTPPAPGERVTQTFCGT